MTQTYLRRMSPWACDTRSIANWHNTRLTRLPEWRMTEAAGY